MPSTTTVARRFWAIGSILALGVVYVLALTLGTILTTVWKRVRAVRGVNQSVETTTSSESVRS